MMHNHLSALFFFIIIMFWTAWSSQAWADDPAMPEQQESWCMPPQEMIVNFKLEKNGKTASICRDEPDMLTYSFGIPGQNLELRYSGKVLASIRGGSAGIWLWGQGAQNLSELAVGLRQNEWYDSRSGLDSSDIEAAARQADTYGFYNVWGSTAFVDQSVYIFRRAGWEYAILEAWGRAMSVPEEDLEDYYSSEIIVRSPEGRYFRLE